MLHIRILAPSQLASQAAALLTDNPAVSSVAVVPGASRKPVGDLVIADVAREAANSVVEQLVALGIDDEGSIQIEPVHTWISKSAIRAQRVAPGRGADSVIWSDVSQRAFEESELNWTHLFFMALATLIAGIAIILDSQILVVGAMILGPEFVAIAGLGLAMVLGYWRLLARSATTLVCGFSFAIAVTTCAALAARALGWIVASDVTGPRPGTAFIYTPDKWSFIVALIAAAAGVLSLTSSKASGLSGVFVSVTTIPAAANVALGIAFGLPDEIRGSLLQLALNIGGMALAGWLTLSVQRVLRKRRINPSATEARRAHPQKPRH